MNELVSLTASGYDWKCPNCETANYSKSVGQLVTCSSCNIVIPVERVVHKLGTTPGLVSVFAAGYSFQCPECREISHIGAVTKEVKCPNCHAKMNVQWLQHNITTVIAAPQTNLVTVSPEPAKEEVAPIAEVHLEPETPKPAPNVEPKPINRKVVLNTVFETGQMSLLA